MDLPPELIIFLRSITEGLLTNLGKNLGRYIEVRWLHYKKETIDKSTPTSHPEDELSHGSREIGQPSQGQPQAANVPDHQVLASWARLLVTQAAKTQQYGSLVLDEVKIVSVTAQEASVVYNIDDLMNFDHGSDITDGLLEVVFKDIPTSLDFDGYIIEAKVCNSLSNDVDDYKSPAVIKRPVVVGSTVTEVLNLEPGTTYSITVYAVKQNMVQISPSQSDQGNYSATTLMTAPLLDTLKTESIGLSDIGSRVGIDDESSIGSKGAVHSHDYTHFQFTTTDENGKIVDRKLIEADDSFFVETYSFFQSVFSAASDDLMLSVSLGRIVDGRYKAFSDTAIVALSIRDNPPKP